MSEVGIGRLQFSEVLISPYERFAHDYDIVSSSEGIFTVKNWFYDDLRIVSRGLPT
jgi:hypothetical protein